MDVFYYIDGAKKYFAKNYNVEFLKVKQFLIDEKKIFFCKECNIKFIEPKKGVCNYCRISKRVAIKFFNLFKTFYEDVATFIQIKE